MVRLRLQELLKERGMTVYGLVRASNGRIAERTAYRLASRGGRVRMLDVDLLDALAETLNCDIADLLERVPGKAKRRKRATAAQ